MKRNENENEKKSKENKNSCIGDDGDKHLRLYGIGHYTMKMEYDMVNKVVCKVASMKEEKVYISRLEKKGRARVFKVSGRKVTDEEVVKKMSEYGESIGMRVKVLGKVVRGRIDEKKRLKIDKLEVGSLNIHSIKDKMELVSWFVNSKKLDILGLQETQRNAKSTRSEEHTSELQSL